MCLFNLALVAVRFVVFFGVFFLYCFWRICLGVPFIALVAAGKSPFIAAEEVAREQEERSAKMKKKQKGKNGKKQKGKNAGGGR